MLAIIALECKKSTQYFQCKLIFCIVFNLVLLFHCGCAHGRIHARNVTATETKTPPHIIVIVADDLGFNDVSFHGSNEIPTPNIDALAYNGVILNSHYTQALCTPSRAAFLTGKYAIHLGLQHLVILEPEPWGLPLNETLLPERLKAHGYKTHAIGKWHLGFFKKVYTPTFRGFDSHFGYWQGMQDYYDHTVHSTFTSEHGYDMRRNMSVDWDAQGKYSTTLFTQEAVKLIREHESSSPMFMYLAHSAPHSGNHREHLQAPDEEIARFAHIEDPARRIFAAMVSIMDRGVGEVVTALREKRMLGNSIIVFLSDNGAKSFGLHANYGSNFPLRGLKNSPWEGGMRCVASVWSPLIKKPQRVSHAMMHITDWVPTLLSAAGLTDADLKEIDGKDQWGMISEDAPTPRTDFVYNIDNVWNYAAIRQGDWKYVHRTTIHPTNQWYGSSGANTKQEYSLTNIIFSPTEVAISGLVTYRQLLNESQVELRLLTADTIQRLRNESIIQCKYKGYKDTPSSYKCDPLLSPCLFNIQDDPCEQRNLADTRPDILIQLEEALLKIRKTMTPPANVPRDPNADPKYWNGTWTNWQDFDSPNNLHFERKFSPICIILIFAAVLSLLALLGLFGFVIFKNQLRNRRHITKSYEKGDTEETCDLQ